MSYTSLIKPLLNNFPFKTKHPKVLEIGMESGKSSLPIIFNLANLYDRFMFLGIDIYIRPQLIETISNFAGVSIGGVHDFTGRDIVLEQENSLQWLDRHKNWGTQFDMVFLDGDHNYYTVSRELKMLIDHIKPETMIICDDFEGKHALKDGFYSEKPGYDKIDYATPRQHCETPGVQTAIVEFIQKNPEWSIFSFADEPDMNHDAVILFRNDIWETPKAWFDLGQVYLSELNMSFVEKVS